MSMVPRMWEPSYGTRLDGFFGEDEKRDKTKQIPNHDDVNCLHDIENAGLIKIVSLVNFYIELTPKGQEVASELRAWKNAGQMYFNFKPIKK